VYTGKDPTRACSLAEQHHDAHTALAPIAGIPPDAALLSAPCLSGSATGHTPHVRSARPRLLAREPSSAGAVGARAHQHVRKVGRARRGDALQLGEVAVAHALVLRARRQQRRLPAGPVSVRVKARVGQGAVCADRLRSRSRSRSARAASSTACRQGLSGRRDDSSADCYCHTSPSCDASRKPRHATRRR